MRAILGAALAIGLMVCADGSRADDAFAGIEAVQAREADFYQAFLDVDRMTFDDILADDFAYQHGSGVTYDEKSFIDLVTGGSVLVTRADTPDMRFRDFGNTIVSYGQGPVTVEFGETTVSGTLRFVNVWHRSPSGQWELHHRNSEFLP